MLNEFVSIGMVVKSFIHAKARQRGLARLSPNVALKSKVVSYDDEYDDEYEDEGGDDDPDEAKYDYSDHMALVSRTFWSNRSKQGSSRLFGRKNKPRGDHPKSCYNCSNLNHFIADCPWENREDNIGRLVRMDKSKASISKNHVKKKVPNALCVQERKVLEEFIR